MQHVRRLVEGDVAVVADAQQLQVGNAALPHLGLQRGGVGLGVAHALGNVGVGLVDVDVVEQVGVHEVAVALVMGLGDAAVFVQVHRAHLGEIHLAGLVGLDELFVHGHGGAAGGKAQLAVGLFVHQLADHVGHIGAALIIALGHDDVHGKHSVLCKFFCRCPGPCPRPRGVSILIIAAAAPKGKPRKALFFALRSHTYSSFSSGRGRLSASSAAAAARKAAGVWPVAFLNTRHR